MKRYRMKKSVLFIPIFLSIVLSMSSLKASAQEDTLAVKKLLQEGIMRLEGGNLQLSITLIERGLNNLNKIAVKENEKNQNMITSLSLTREAERFIKAENYEGALELLNQAIDLWDANIEAYKFRGSVRLVLEEKIPKEKERDYIGLNNDYTNAVRIIDRSINAAPRNSQERKEAEREKAKVLINRAYVKLQSGRTPGFFSAIDDYTEAVRLDDQNWDGFLGRAVAYNRIKDYRKEANDYIKSFQLMQQYEFRLNDDPFWADLYITLARAYVNLGDKRNAYDYAQRSYNLGNMQAEEIMIRNRP